MYPVSHVPIIAIIEPKVNVFLGPYLSIKYPAIGIDIADTNMKIVNPKDIFVLLTLISSDIGLSSNPKVYLVPTLKRSIVKPIDTIIQR